MIQQGFQRFRNICQKTFDGFVIQIYESNSGIQK